MESEISTSREPKKLSTAEAGARPRSHAPVVALLLFVLAVLSIPAAVACTRDISYVINPSHIMYQGECSTEAEALAACRVIAAEHGYAPENYCGSPGTAEGTAAGGWFWEKAGEIKEPFHYAMFHYGAIHPPKDYENQSTPSCEDQCFGDPINTGNANKFEHMTEYMGGGSFPLQWSWYYNYKLNQSFAHPKVFLLGTNRTHFYSRSVLSISTSLGSMAYVSRPDGNSRRFELIGTTWQPRSGERGQLIETTSAGTRTGWIYEDGDGGTETFNAEGLLIELRSRDGRSQTLTYDVANILKTVTDDSGRSLQFDSDSSQRISKVTLPDGTFIQFRYSSSGNLSEVEHPGSSVRSYLYNEAGFVTVNTAGGALTGVVDEASNRVSSTTYDNSSRAIAVSLGNGIGSSYSAVYSGLTFSPSTSVTLPSGAIRTVTHTVVNGKILPQSATTTCSGCVPSTTAYSFDTNANLSSTTTNGTLRTYQHDSLGRITQLVEAADDATGNKRTLQTDWHGSIAVPQERRTYDASGVLSERSTWSYNSRGQVLSTSLVDPLAGTTRVSTVTYCESADVISGTCPLVGLVKSVDGARTDIADTTTYTYYPSDDATCSAAPTTCPHRKGDLWKVTNALGQITETLAYDGAGRVLSVKDANGVVSDTEYHPRGWLTARKTRGTNASVETDDAITRIEYWPTRLVKKVIQPDGAFTLYTYDAAHRLTDIADNAGNTIHYTLDNAGNRTQEDTKDPGNVLKRTLSRVYNQLGQLQTQADAQANPTDFTYDANGNTNTVTDALSRITDNDYDPLNRLSRTLQNVGGINAETKFAYDARDNLTQVTDPKGLNTSYTYNGLGDLTQLVSPDTGTTTYTYDSAGNRATQTDARGKLSAYSYDALNRLTGIGYPNTGYNIVYTYDSNQSVCATGETFSQGRLTKLADASGTTQYCFDRFGNLVRKVQTTNAKVFTVRYAYTLAGQLSSVTYPDGAIASYVRDAQGRTTQVNVQRTGAASEVLLNQASYHPFGPVAGWTYGNGRQLLRPLNQNYQPTAVQDTSTGGLSVGFAYDPVGNLTQLTPAGDGAPLVKFDYDALSRLTTFKDGPTDVAIESYAYDATGNRQSFTNSVGTQAYTYPSTSHRLSSVGSVARSYDAAGNTNSIGGTAKQFIYDDTGRMGQVKQAGVAVMNYRYNGKGEQVRKYLSTTNTYTVYDESGHWLGDYDSTGAALQQAIWLDDLPVGLIANGNQLHYVEPDHLGTPRVVIEVARNVPVWTWDLKSEAFGNSVPNQDPDGDANAFVFNMRFPGQRYDAVSGLNQNGFRDGYDSGAGRYTQSDPIGLQGGVSSYGYAFGNPLSYIDPLGLKPNQACVAGWIASCAVVGGTAGFIGGGLLGGVAGTAVTPIAGTAAGAIGGAELGGLGGAAAGGIAGGIIGGAVCADVEDNKEECEELLRVDTDTCNAITRRRGGRAGAACHASASERYAACHRGTPIPPLNTWNN